MSRSNDKGPQKAAINRTAFRDYIVLDKITAGIELRGTEIKSIRSGNVSLTGSYASVENNECFLHHMHVAAYEYAGVFNHDPLRCRRLLLHHREILRLQSATEQKGHTLIPLSLFFQGSHLKVELGTCKGKTHSDKRETIRRKEADREAERAMRRGKK